MELNKKDSKKFWKLLDKLKMSNNDKDFISSISEKNWKEYFGSILTKKTTRNTQTIAWTRDL